MFKFTKKEKTMLEQEIEEVLKEMGSMHTSDDEYATILERLERLYKLQEKKETCKVSPDTLAVVVGNLLGIVLILKHEELNVVTSKALGFVLRGRA